MIIIDQKEIIKISADFLSGVHGSKNVKFAAAGKSRKNIRHHAVLDLRSRLEFNARRRGSLGDTVLVHDHLITVLGDEYRDHTEQQINQQTRQETVKHRFTDDLRRIRTVSEDRTSQFFLHHEDGACRRRGINVQIGDTVKHRTELGCGKCYDAQSRYQYRKGLGAISAGKQYGDHHN